MNAFVQIGDRHFPLTLVRNQLRASLTDGKSLPYVFAQVAACHHYDCPSTMVKNYGPCECGGEELFRGLLREAEDSP